MIEDIGLRRPDLQRDHRGAKHFIAPESCPSITFSKEASSYPSKDEDDSLASHARTEMKLFPDR